jgi:hypothetical protein
MYFCRTCGQCSYIDSDNFYEVVDISGTETRYLDCITGGVVDYGDTDTDSTGDSTTYCPNCDSDDLNTTWEGTQEEALNLRKGFDDAIQRRRDEMIAKEVKQKIINSDWDLAGN